MMQKAETSPYDKLGYIKAGKTFHLDGFNVGNVANRWVDMIHGHQWYSNKGEDLVFEAGGLVSQKLISQTDVVGSRDMFTSTLEIVMEITNTLSEFCVRLGGAKRLCFGRYNSQAVLSTDRETGGGPMINSLTSLYGKKITISIQSDSILVNGNSLTKNSRLGFSNYANGIGSTGGHLYAVRLYNRLLTDEERLYNVNVDNERFNLGLTL